MVSPSLSPLIMSPSYLSPSTPSIQHDPISPIKSSVGPSTIQEYQTAYIMAQQTISERDTDLQLAAQLGEMMTNENIRLTNKIKDIEEIINTLQQQMEEKEKEKEQLHDENTLLHQQLAHTSIEGQPHPLININDSIKDFLISELGESYVDVDAIRQIKQKLRQERKQTAITVSHLRDTISQYQNDISNYQHKISTLQDIITSYHHSYQQQQTTYNTTYDRLLAQHYEMMNEMKMKMRHISQQQVMWIQTLEEKCKEQEKQMKEIDDRYMDLHRLYRTHIPPHLIDTIPTRHTIGEQSQPPSVDIHDTNTTHAQSHLQSRVDEWIAGWKDEGHTYQHNSTTTLVQTKESSSITCAEQATAIHYDDGLHPNHSNATATLTQKPTMLHFEGESSPSTFTESTTVMLNDGTNTISMTSAIVPDATTPFSLVLRESAHPVVDTSTTTTQTNASHNIPSTSTTSEFNLHPSHSLHSIPSPSLSSTSSHPTSPSPTPPRFPPPLSHGMPSSQSYPQSLSSHSRHISASLAYQLAQCMTPPISSPSQTPRQGTPRNLMRDMLSCTPTAQPITSPRTITPRMASPTQSRTSPQSSHVTSPRTIGRGMISPTQSMISPQASHITSPRTITSPTPSLISPRIISPQPRPLSHILSSPPRHPIKSPIHSRNASTFTFGSVSLMPSITPTRISTPTTPTPPSTDTCNDMIVDANTQSIPIAHTTINMNTSTNTTSGVITIPVSGVEYNPSSTSSTSLHFTSSPTLSLSSSPSHHISSCDSSSPTSPFDMMLPIRHRETFMHNDQYYIKPRIRSYSTNALLDHHIHYHMQHHHHHHPSHTTGSPHIMSDIPVSPSRTLFTQTQPQAHTQTQVQPHRIQSSFHSNQYQPTLTALHPLKQQHQQQQQQQQQSHMMSPFSGGFHQPFISSSSNIHTTMSDQTPQTSCIPTSSRMKPVAHTVWFGSNTSTSTASTSASTSTSTSTSTSPHVIPTTPLHETWDTEPLREEYLSTTSSHHHIMSGMERLLAQQTLLYQQQLHEQSKQGWIKRYVMPITSWMTRRFMYFMLGMDMKREKIAIALT